MGFFTNSKQHRDEVRPESGDSQKFLEETASDATSVTPFDMEAKERRRHLEALKQRANRIATGFYQVEQVIADAERSTSELSAFLEEHQLQIENEKRLKIENARLSRDNEDMAQRLQAAEGQLEKRNAEIEALKNRNNEYRATIDKARTAITQLREKQQYLTEDIEKKNTKLLNALGRNEETDENLGQLTSRFNLLEEEHAEISQQLDAQIKIESELRQKLSENAALLDEEVRKSRMLMGDLESNKRELSEMNVKFIDLKSEHDALGQEVDYLKMTREDDQRKFDNRQFAMKSEIDSLASDRRLALQSMNELKAENAQLKKTTRDAEALIQRQKSELANLHKAQERDRQQIVRNNEKLSDLNLRYNSALTDFNHEQRQRENLQQKIEKLAEENNRLLEYRESYESASRQLADLKTLVAEYQQLLENVRGTPDKEAFNLMEEEEADLSNVSAEGKTLQ